MARTRKLAEQVKSKSGKKGKQQKVHTIDTERLLNTGSTLLNLACADHSGGGFQMGKMVNVIGDSSSGKSILSLSVFAEAARDPKFDDYLFIYDDCESAREFDMEKLFGKKATSRMKAPRYDKEGEELPSDTVQDFHMHLRKYLKQGKPFIYILDSFDALDAEEDDAKVEEAMKAREQGKKAAGSFGMAKAKGSSAILRDITRLLRSTNSLLIIVSQTRQDINPASFSSKTRSGGDALRFYATHEIWTAVVQTLTKTVNKKKFATGVQVRARISKNKVTGKKREIEFPIYYDLGIDDISSCVDFLVDNDRWDMADKGTKIKAHDLDLDATKDKLIRTIESDDLEDQLRDIVQEVWNDREARLKLDRKGRYD